MVPKNQKQLVSKRQVQQMIRSNFNQVIEHKFITYSTAPFAINNSGSIIDFTTPSQGVLDTDRVGDSILVTSVEANFWALVGAQEAAMRIIVFQWLPNTVPNVSDILFSSGTSQAPLGSFVQDTRKLFRVMYDSLFGLNQAYETHAIRRVSLKNLKIPVQFAQTTTAGTNKVYALFISSNGSSSPTLGYSFQIHFDDS